MRLFDAFMVFDETRVLDLRFDELRSVVDCHVVVEAPVTFQGKPKALAFTDNAAIHHWREQTQRISYYVARDELAHYENASHPLEREAAQRDALLPALLKAGAEDDDLVIISDADEVPRASVLRMLKLYPPDDIVRLGLALHYYTLNLRNMSVPQWYGPRVCRLRELYAQPPEVLRHNNNCRAIDDAGWSWSFFGAAIDAKRKLAAWSHAEWNVPPHNTLQNLDEAIRSGVDWDRERNMTFQAQPVFPEAYPASLFKPIAGTLKGRWKRFITPTDIPA